MINSNDGSVSLIVDLGLYIGDRVRFIPQESCASAQNATRSEGSVQCESKNPTRGFLTFFPKRMGIF